MTIVRIPRVRAVEVYDARENTIDTDEVLVSSTMYGCDSYSQMGGMESYSGLANPPGHLSSYVCDTVRVGSIGKNLSASLASTTGFLLAAAADLFLSQSRCFGHLQFS